MTVAEDIDLELQTRVDAIPYWYHKIELPGGIITPGEFPLNAVAYRLPDSFAGKRILDVGAWDGYWTFEALKRGAAQVVAIDDWSDMPAFRRNGKPWDTFDLCKQAFGYTDEQCQHRTLSLYSLAQAGLGDFDCVFLFGTIYHCRYPMLALDMLSRSCKGDIWIESTICDDYSPYRGSIQVDSFKGLRCMEFYPGKELGDNATNWWAPTLQCLAWMTVSAGWNRAEHWKLINDPREVAYCRGFVHGLKEK